VALDRGEELLSLTRLGQETYAEIIPRAVAFQQSLLERLGEDAQGLVAALDRLEADVGVK
jgi:DNA-binding MarR family transcriptional regulator